MSQSRSASLNRQKDAKQGFNSLFGSSGTPETPEPPKPAPETLPEGLKQIQMSIAADKWKEDQTAAIYRQYQETRMKASTGMTAIIKGAKEGESVHALFLQALEVIDTLANDGGIFIRTVKKNMDFVADEAIEAAVNLSSRYINDRFLPDKAIDLIVYSAAAAHRKHQSRRNRHRKRCRRA